MAVCRVCGVELASGENWYTYHERHGVIDYIYSTKGQTNFYCSRKCFGVSNRKSYREASPYAKNIKRIRKEVGL